MYIHDCVLAVPAAAAVGPGGGRGGSIDWVGNTSRIQSPKRLCKAPKHYTKIRQTV